MATALEVERSQVVFAPQTQRPHIHTHIPDRAVRKATAETLALITGISPFATIMISESLYDPPYALAFGAITASFFSIYARIQERKLIRGV